jgi:hypothetical protein
MQFHTGECRWIWLHWCTYELGMKFHRLISNLCSKCFYLTEPWLLRLEAKRGQNWLVTLHSKRWNAFSSSFCKKTGPRNFCAVQCCKFFREHICFRHGLSNEYSVNISQKNGRQNKLKLGAYVRSSAPAGNHQLVAEDLMEDGTISRISDAYSLWRGRRLHTTNIGSQRIAICNCNVKKEIKPPHWGGKL